MPPRGRSNSHGFVAQFQEAAVTFSSNRWRFRVPGMGMAFIPSLRDRA
jgi:hypothetical protein